MLRGTDPEPRKSRTPEVPTTAEAPGTAFTPAAVASAASGPPTAAGEKCEEGRLPSQWSRLFGLRRPPVTSWRGTPQQSYRGGPPRGRGEWRNQVPSFPWEENKNVGEVPAKRRARLRGTRSTRGLPTLVAATQPAARQALVASSSEGIGASASLVHLEIPTAATAAPAVVAVTPTAREGFPRLPLNVEDQRQQQDLSNSTGFARGFSGTSNNARRVARRYKQYVRRRLRRLQQQRQKKHHPSKSPIAAAKAHSAASASGAAFSSGDRGIPLLKLSPQCSYFDEDEFRSDSECAYSPLQHAHADPHEGKSASPREALASPRWQHVSSRWGPREDPSKQWLRGAPVTGIGLPATAAGAAEKSCSDSASFWGGGQFTDIETPRGSEAATWGDCGGGALGLEIRMLNAIEQSILLFNQRPEDGILHMQRLRLLENSPEAIATFLLVTEGGLNRLDRHLVAQVLGGSEARSVLLLRAFVSLLDLSNKDVEEALRHFCSFVPLAGEAQVVYRMLEMLSVAYKEANPDSPLTAESVHVLLYALLILNTSLHNPIVKRSRQAAMSRTIFCQMVEAAGVGLSPESLGQLYSRIANEELRTVHSVSEQIYIRLSREECANASGEAFSLQADAALSEGFDVGAGLALFSSRRCADHHCCRPHCSCCPCCPPPLLPPVGARGQEGPCPLFQQGDKRDITTPLHQDAEGPQGSGRTPSRMLTTGVNPGPCAATPIPFGVAGRVGAVITIDAPPPTPATTTLASALGPGGCREVSPHDLRGILGHVEWCSYPADASPLWELGGDQTLSGWAQEVAPGESLTWQFVSAGIKDIRLGSRPPRHFYQQQQEQQKRQQQQKGPTRSHEGCGSTCRFSPAYWEEPQHSIGNRWAYLPPPRAAAGQPASPFPLDCCCHHDHCNRHQGRGEATEDEGANSSRPRFHSTAIGTAQKSSLSKRHREAQQRKPRGAGAENVSAAGPRIVSPSSPQADSDTTSTPAWGEGRRTSARGDGDMGEPGAPSLGASNTADRHQRSCRQQVDWTAVASFASDTLGLHTFPKLRTSSRLSLLLLLDVSQIHRKYIRQRTRWGTIQVVQAEQNEAQQQRQQRGHRHEQQEDSLCSSSSGRGLTSPAISTPSDHSGDAALLRWRATLPTGEPAQGPDGGSNRDSNSSSINSNSNCCSGTGSNSSNNNSNSSSMSSSDGISRRNTKGRSCITRFSLALGSGWLWKRLRALGRPKATSRTFPLNELRTARMVPCPNGGDRLVLDFVSTRIVLQLQPQRPPTPGLAPDRGNQKLPTHQEPLLPLQCFLTYLHHALLRNAETERRIQEANALRNVQQARSEEQQLEEHWAASGFSLMLQHCFHLADVGGIRQGQKLLQANCARRSALRIQRQGPAAEAETGESHHRSSSHGLLRALLPDIQQPHQQKETRRSCPAVPSSISAPPLRRRLAVSLCRMTSRCSQKLWLTGPTRCPSGNSLALLFLRGMPPCLRRFLWPQSLLMASQHAHGSPHTLAVSMLEKTRGAAHPRPLRPVHNSSSNSVYRRISQAIGDPPADTFYIFGYDDFLLLQAEASRAAQHTKHQRLRHPGAAPHDKPAAAATPPAAAIAAASSPSATAGIADPDEACLASMAQLVAVTTESSQSTAACNTRECSSCSNASGGGFWSATGDSQSCGETAASCTADRRPPAPPIYSSCDRRSGSESACEFISYQEGICGNTALHTPSERFDAPGASLQTGCLSPPRILQKNQEEGPPQLVPQIRIYDPVSGSPPSAAQAGIGSTPAQSATSRPTGSPTRRLATEDREDVAATTPEMGCEAAPEPTQEEPHFPPQQMLAPAAANATTHRDRAHLRRLRHALPRVYPQLQQLPQRYGSLVLPECSAEQLMALDYPEATESPHSQQGRYATARHCHCCCPPRSRASSLYYSCTFCANPASPGSPTSDSFLPLPRCTCCQESVAAACRIDAASNAPEAEAAKAPACGDCSKGSASSSSKKNNTSDRAGSRPSITSNGDCSESIGAGLRSVMESLFLLLPDCGSIDSLAKVAVVLLYYLDAYTTLNFLLRLMSLPPLSGLLLLRPLAGRSLREEVASFRRLFVAAFPTLSAYFGGISLSPTLVLLPLVASLFLCALPVHVAVRVWDVVLLPCCHETQQNTQEADSLTLRLYQVVFGILKYHEEALLSSNLEGCMALLYTPPPPTVFDSPRFFQAFQSIDIYKLPRGRVSRL